MLGWGRLLRIMMAGAIGAALGGHIAPRADIISAVTVPATIRIYNAQGFAQSGEIVVSPLGQSAGVADEVIPYSLGAHAVGSFQIPAGRVAVQPGVDDLGNPRPDPVVDLEAGGVSSPVYTAAELSNGSWLAGRGSSTVLHAGAAGASLLVYDASLNPSAVSLPPSGSSVIQTSDRFFIDIVSGSVTGSSYRTCGSTLVEKLTPRRGFSPLGRSSLLPDGYLPGDCDRNGSVAIGEVQKAINGFLGQPSGCLVDVNGDGMVSIGEVQKVINSFLGLPQASLVRAYASSAPGGAVTSFPRTCDEVTLPALIAGVEHVGKLVTLYRSPVVSVDVAYEGFSCSPAGEIRFTPPASSAGLTLPVHFSLADGDIVRVYYPVVQP